MHADFDALNMKRQMWGGLAQLNSSLRYWTGSKADWQVVFAYVASNGDVMFEVKKFDEYGKLSKSKTLISFKLVLVVILILQKHLAVRFRSLEDV